MCTAACAEPFYYLTEEKVADCSERRAPPAELTVPPKGFIASAASILRHARMAGVGGAASHAADHDSMGSYD